MREGRYRLLYVSPERLAGEGSDGFLTRLAKCDVQFVAVDEAHCISQWGHDFRPEYRQLGGLRSYFPNVSLHAYTATATARVRRDIAAQLGLQNPIELVGSIRSSQPHLPRAGAREPEASDPRRAWPGARARPASSIARPGRKSMRWRRG